MHRRELITLTSTLCAGAAAGWMPMYTHAVATGPSTGRRIGANDVTALDEVGRALIRLETASGGAAVRRPADAAISTMVLPVLNGRFRSDAVRRDAFARCAYILNVAGFAADDTSDHRRSWSLLSQALRLAEASGDQATASTVRSDLALVSIRTGRTSDAVALTDAAQHPDIPSAHSARAFAQSARAFSNRGDAQSARRALGRASEAMEQRRPEGRDELTLMFTSDHLAFESAVAEVALSPQRALIQLAGVQPRSGMPRRTAAAAALTARAHLRMGDPRTAAPHARRAVEAAQAVDSAVVRTHIAMVFADTRPAVSSQRRCRRPAPGTRHNDVEGEDSTIRLGARSRRESPRYDQLKAHRQTTAQGRAAPARRGRAGSGLMTGLHSTHGRLSRQSAGYAQFWIICVQHDFAIIRGFDPARDAGCRTKPIGSGPTLR